MANKPTSADQIRTTPRSNTEHTRMIEVLCANDPEMRTRSFWRAVDKLTDELEFCDPVRRQSFIPDAYKINREAQELEIHEVVRTNDVSARKMLMMGCLWGEFDNEQEEWHPVLIVHREGYEPRRIELLSSYIAVIRSQAEIIRLNATAAGGGR